MNTAKRLRLLPLPVALVLVLASCGSDSTASSSAEPTATTTTTTVDVGNEAVATVDVGNEAVATEPSGETPADVVETAYTDSYELADEEYGTMVTVTVADGWRTIDTNALPDHETGEFPNSGNPNEITEQENVWVFPTTTSFTGDSTSVRTSGVAVNGVKFEPGTGESVACSSGENYRIEALQDTYDLGFDVNNAHVQPDGEYHYHGISEMLVDAYSNDEDLVHVGFASDGYLMYYSKSLAYDSSWVLVDGVRAGTDCVASGPDGTVVDLDGSTPDGVYTSDWIFEDGAGDLDVCNGTTIDGQYAYIITDTFPFVSRCLNGDLTGVEGIGGGGAGPGTGNDAAPPAQP